MKYSDIPSSASNHKNLKNESNFLTNTDYLPDSDPEETKEWLLSLDAILKNNSPDRVKYLLLRLLEHAGKNNVPIPPLTSTDYVNTIPVEDEPSFPGDEEIERRYRAYIRWNAAVMVHRAQRPGVEVGGHISTYASSAALYEVGFNHFFKGPEHPDGADQLFIQGHAAPGIYARAYLEGRLTTKQLDGFRQELSNPGGGLPSYPHPRLLPNFWQFPTVSMGLGALNAVYQARLNKYLYYRGIKDTSKQYVWAFLGDGEMDEPESRGVAQIAVNEGLDNLIFVINCNLQRLDGPVRGNGKIIQELESFFRGVGWNVIKVVWGREWDKLFLADPQGALINLMNQTNDGDYQTYKSKDGAYIREHFFGRTSETAKLVENLTDTELWGLKRGGHDYKKIYAAYRIATEKNGKPTVILAHTIKGYGLGKQFEAKNATHQMKKMTLADLKNFRDTQRIPISDKELEADPYLPPYFHPGFETAEIKYMLAARKKLGGFLPQRGYGTKTLSFPSTDPLAELKKGSGKQKVATTMALVRGLRELLKDKVIGSRIVPIIPDEARTFGMDSWFHNLKIYNPKGQNYTSVDADIMLTYKEAKDGQILHEGINEAGSSASFIAAGTSYSTHNEPLIPVYIFYSMFGFQRTGDNFWAAADQMSRGFLIGATAGRTTLTGEGLQHNDGHSLLLAHTNPAVHSYDPAFSFELAFILEHAIKTMYDSPSLPSTKSLISSEGDMDASNIIYYLTVYNEPIIQPALPTKIDTAGIIKGIYAYQTNLVSDVNIHISLLAAGIAMQAALTAQELLATRWRISSTVYSVTSWSVLNRQAQTSTKPYVKEILSEHVGPFIAVSDWINDVPELIRKWIPGDYYTLGTNGFGFSDTRTAARKFYHTDANSIVFLSLLALHKNNKVSADVIKTAANEYKIDISSFDSQFS